MLFSLSLHKNKGIGDGCDFHGKNKNHGLVSSWWKQIKLSQARLSPSYFPSESSSLQRALTRSRYSCFVVCVLPPCAGSFTKTTWVISRQALLKDALMLVVRGRVVLGSYYHVLKLCTLFYQEKKNKEIIRKHLFFSFLCLWIWYSTNLFADKSAAIFPHWLISLKSWVWEGIEWKCLFFIFHTFKLLMVLLFASR